jgi:hypothetical protein
MVDSGGGASLLLEPAHASGIAGRTRRDDFHRNITAEPSVVCTIHFTHSTGTN